MAKRNASSAARWSNCPGSIQQEQKAPPFRGNKYTEEGTQAHLVAEVLALGKELPENVDPEMEANGRIWLEFIESVRAQGIVWERVEAKYRSRKIDGPSGVMDYVALLKDGGAVVADYKYGMGQSVSPEGNQQLLSYALLLEEIFHCRFDYYQGVIVQPRSFEDASTKTWDFTADEVDEFRQLVTKNLDSTKLVPGDWCGWCPALSICPELKREAMNAARMKFIDSDTELLELYHKTGAIKKYLDSIPGQLIGAIREGAKIPGLEVYEGQGYRTWTVQEPTTLADVLGVDVDEICERKLLTPAAVEKVLGIKVSSDLVERPSLGPRLRKSKNPGNPPSVKGRFNG